jgi:glutamyl-tRNA reductase
VQARLGGLSIEQIAAVEALTRGLVNKFLHPPMQALKQAAREGDQMRLEAVCEEWSVSASADRAGEHGSLSGRPNGEASQPLETEKPESDRVSAAEVETRR